MKRDSQIVATIAVDQPVPAPATVDQPRIGHLESSRDASDPYQHLRDANSWSSPIFVKGKRLSSGSFVDASLDPFADDDGFVVGKGRKRTKFARHSDSWRLVDRTPSPEKELVDLHLEDVNGFAETTPLRPEPQSADHDVEAVDEQAEDLARFDSRSGHVSIAGGDIQQLPQSPEPPDAEIVLQVPDAAYSLRSPLSGRGRMQPPTTPPRRAPRVSDMTIDFRGRNNIQHPARSDLETPRLAPLPSPGLPLVSPLISRTGLSLGYFPDTSESRSELDASGEQSLPVLEASVTSSNEPTPSLAVESLLSPAEAEKPPMQEPEAAHRDNLSDVPSLHQRLSPQLDEPVQPMSWSSDEVVRQPHTIHHGEEQALAHVEALHFEFLNTSLMDASTDAQNMWHFIETSAGPMATTEAHRDTGPVEATEVLELQADISEVRRAGPVDDAQSVTLPHDLSKSDTPTLNIGGAKQDENVDDISDISPDSHPKVPMDPRLMTGLEEAAEFVTGSKINVQIPAELPDRASGSRPWNDSVDMSKIEDESKGVYASPPLPFEQRWHGEPRRRRNRPSSQYASLDGMSDEVSGAESSEVGDVSEDPLRLEMLDNNRRTDVDLDAGQTARDSCLMSSPASVAEPGYRRTEVPGKDVDFSESHSPNGSQSVIVLDLSDEESTSGGKIKNVMEDAISGSAVGHAEDALDLKASEADDARTEMRVSANNLGELEVDRIEDPALPPLPAYGKSPSPAIDTLVVGERERSRTEESQEKHQDLSGEPLEPPTEAADFARPLEEWPAQRLNDQLATPENTQRQEGDTQLQGHTAEVGREISLPPTPQNTQEFADLSQQTVELPIPAKAEIKASQTPNMPLLTSVDEIRERRRSPRLSRKFPPSQDVTEAVSPYFAPRRSSQMRARNQLRTPSKSATGEPNPAAANDTTQMVHQESTLRGKVLPNKEIALVSPLLGQPTAGFATLLSYYAPLALLQDHFSQDVDVLALSTTNSTEPQKADSGPGDWHTTLHLTEHSLQGNETITAQVFRPNKTALPKLQRGNIVLLRSFKVQSRKRKYMLLSTESSAWAAFDVRMERGGEASNIDAVTAGPPVEYGAEEKAYVVALKKWWDATGEDLHPVQRQANPSNKTVRVPSRGDGCIVTHELRGGKVYRDPTDSEEKAGVSEPYHELRDGTVYGDHTQGKALNPDLKSGQVDDLRTDTGTLHELRDSTAYQDDPPIRAPKSRQRISNVRTTSGPTQDDNVETKKESPRVGEDQDGAQELEPIDVDGQAEMDSEDESAADAAVSSQIYHELRNGRRYADPTTDQKHTDEPHEEEGHDEDESLVHELRGGTTYTDE